MTKQIKFQSFGELIYYFFRKKKCPVCGSTLRKIKKEDKKGFQIWKTGAGEYEFGNLSIITISYHCPKCRYIKSLNEIYNMQREID